ncbi:MAG: hypothetical protein S4CHLAM6_08690 [Chlamydiae bacterium]|nr:hypothetical protein [Chlamydiota bacterium]
MIKKPDLTNEKLTKLFSNPFELVSSAINIAHQVVGSGRELKDGTNRNVASQILKKILKDHESEKQSAEMLEAEENGQIAVDNETSDSQQ